MVGEHPLSMWVSIAVPPVITAGLVIAEGRILEDLEPRNEILVLGVTIWALALSIPLGELIARRLFRQPSGRIVISSSGDLKGMLQDTGPLSFLSRPIGFLDRRLIDQYGLYRTAALPRLRVLLPQSVSRLLARAEIAVTWRLGLASGSVV